MKCMRVKKRTNAPQIGLWRHHGAFRDKKRRLGGIRNAYGGQGRTEIPADDRGPGMAGGRMWRKTVWTFFPMWLLLK